MSRDPHSTDDLDRLIGSMPAAKVVHTGHAGTAEVLRRAGYVDMQPPVLTPDEWRTAATWDTEKAQLRREQAGEAGYDMDAVHRRCIAFSNHALPPGEGWDSTDVIRLREAGLHDLAGRLAVFLPPA